MVFCVSPQGAESRHAGPARANPSRLRPLSRRLPKTRLTWIRRRAAYDAASKYNVSRSSSGGDRAVNVWPASASSWRCAKIFAASYPALAGMSRSHLRSAYTTSTDVTPPVCVYETNLGTVW